MGGAVSIISVDEKPMIKVAEVPLRQLPDAIEEAIYIHEKFPLIIDPTEQAARFLKYQTGTFLNFEDPVQCTKKSLNRALVGSMQFGRTFTVKFDKLQGLSVNSPLFDSPTSFPIEILSRPTFFAQEDIWRALLRPELGDDPEIVSISPEFVFIACVSSDDVTQIPPELFQIMHVFKVVEKQSNNGDESSNTVDPEMDQIAALYGAKEIVRNSLELVEAVFDGDLEGMQSLIDKGYHLESCDGRKHTALSEAACQGHLPIVSHLLASGADPNALSDTGRSPLWRAAFNGHVQVVAALLQAGSNPEFRDRISMESAFDVAQSEEVRQLLSEWDIRRTEQLMQQRRQVMLASLEARIKTSAERELLARNLIRKELVEKATCGDTEGVRQLLEMVAAECRSSSKQGQQKVRPRATVEVRNDGGQSLLSIAAQNDDLELAQFLLTHWKTLLDDDYSLSSDELSDEAKIFKANPNSRDLKGWTCVCIAVFHDSRKVLPLLLQNGGDPSMRSTYNKNAWDISKDELDAAEHVIKSKAEIRQVLLDHAEVGGQGLFGSGLPGRVGGADNKQLYEGLGDDGGAMVMNIEMMRENGDCSNINTTTTVSKIKKKIVKKGTAPSKKK
mmetsp:Transcript_6552/g.9810  ORF Transcript_6552/g.9810 Transcript_6552/m.9810 type:complete len:616 (+) Transcript_6552:33-1880(+)